jgi:hypothetical protein
MTSPTRLLSGGKTITLIVRYISLHSIEIPCAHLCIKALHFYKVKSAAECYLWLNVISRFMSLHFNVPFTKVTGYYYHFVNVITFGP